MGEIRYIVTLRGDAAQGLEAHLPKATGVVIEVEASYPWGTGKAVTRIEHLPDDPRAEPVLLWDAATSGS